MGARLPPDSRACGRPRGSVKPLKRNVGPTKPDLQTRPSPRRRWPQHQPSSGDHSDPRSAASRRSYASARPYPTDNILLSQPSTIERSGGEMLRGLDHPAGGTARVARGRGNHRAALDGSADGYLCSPRLGDAFVEHSALPVIVGAPMRAELPTEMVHHKRSAKGLAPLDGVGTELARASALARSGAKA